MRAAPAPSAVPRPGRVQSRVQPPLSGIKPAPAPFLPIPSAFSLLPIGPALARGAWEPLEVRDCSRSSLAVRPSGTPTAPWGSELRVLPLVPRAGAVAAVRVPREGWGRCSAWSGSFVRDPGSFVWVEQTFFSTVSGPSICHLQYLYSCVISELWYLVLAVPCEYSQSLKIRRLMHNFPWLWESVLLPWSFWRKAVMGGHSRTGNSRPWEWQNAFALF